MKRWMFLAVFLTACGSRLIDQPIDVSADSMTDVSLDSSDASDVVVDDASEAAVSQLPDCGSGLHCSLACLQCAHACCAPLPGGGFDPSCCSVLRDGGIPDVGEQ